MGAAAFLLSLFLADPVLARHVESARSGPWSQSSTWRSGAVPGPSDDVEIAPGDVVTIDVATAAARGARVRGTLAFDRSGAGRLALSGGNVAVEPGGLLEMKGGVVSPSSAPAARGPAFERLKEKIGGLIESGREFDAMQLTLQMLALFPDDPACLGLQERIVMEAAKRPAYGAGHAAYYQGKWGEAAARLSVAEGLDPTNEEIRRFLDEATKREGERRELERMKEAARISYLYDLAHTAYSAGDDPKALKILDEVLNISQYAPAVRLTIQILDEEGLGSRPAAGHGEGKTDSKKAEGLYYQAIRKYGSGDLAGAVEQLRDAQVLDPESNDIRATLERAEREWKESRRQP